MLGMASPFAPGAPVGSGPASSAAMPAAAPAQPAPQPAAAQPAPAKMAKTMLGFTAPPAPVPAPGPPAAVPAPSPVAAPVPAPQPAAPSLQQGGGKQTLLGIAVPGAVVAPPAAQAAQQAAQQPAPAARGGGAKTLLGMPAAPPAASAQKSNKGKTLIMGSVPAASGAPLRRTLLGIPLPGPPAAPPEPEYVEEWYEELVPETGAVERRVRLVEKPPPPLHRRPAFYAVVGAVVLLVGGVAIALLVKSPPPLVAEPRLDAAGKDVLHVTCKTCPDGTVVTLPSGKGTVANGETDVPLTEALKVGSNKLAIALDRPGSGRDETVDLDVPVAYRIWPELGALQDQVPVVRVMIEALPGASVTVAGKPVSLTPEGQGNAKIDVTEAIAGLSRDTKTLEKEIPYTVATQGRAPESGKLSVRVGIAPLWLESPGNRMTTEAATFMLAGRTVKGGGLTVAGRAISVGADGAFAQLMNISTVGATEVSLRASAPSLAPRIATITVKRVASLAAEGKDLEAQTKTTYADVLGKGEDVAQTPVVWRGEVVQSSTQGHQTIAVVEVTTGCAKRPCRARVVWPGGSALATSDKVLFGGRVTGLVTLGDAKLPDVEAELLVKAP